MAGFNFEDRLRLALREAAQREMQAGATARSAARARGAFQTARRSFAPAAAAGLATVLALALVAVFLTRAGSDREAVHPPEVVARLTLADSLGAALSAHGSVWLADTSGDRLLRVDPESNRVIGRIPVQGDLAMAPVGKTLWVLNQNFPPRPGDFQSLLMRVDPGSNAVTARLPLRIPSGEPFAGLDVAADGESVWILGTTATWHDDDQLGVIRLDARSGRVTAAIPLPRGWGRVGIALRADGLWAITANQRLLRFDVRSGERLSAARLNLPADAREPTRGQLRFAGKTLITSTPGGLTGIDPYAGRVVWRRQLGQSVQAWTEADGLVWAAVSPQGPDRLVAVDPGDGRSATSAPLDAFGSADIASFRDELWITTTGGEALILRR
jgi:streptogramin lyase